MVVTSYAPEFGKGGVGLIERASRSGALGKGAGHGEHDAFGPAALGEVVMGDHHPRRVRSRPVLTSRSRTVDPAGPCAGRAATLTPFDGTLSGSVVVINTARFLGAGRSPWATT